MSMSATQASSAFYKQSVKLRKKVQDAYDAQGLGEAPRALPAALDGLAAAQYSNEIVSQALTAMGPAPAPSPSPENLDTAGSDLQAAITARPSLLATDATGVLSAIGDEASIAAFRTAVGATTLAGGYGGNATTDALSLLLAFLTTNLP